MIQIKPGVRILGVKPETVLGIVIVSQVYSTFGYDCVVTSLTDGEHSRGSLHYAGLAFDTRTRTVAGSDLPELVKVLREVLGEDWDVVQETTHLHFEYQPKEP